MKKAFIIIAIILLVLGAAIFFAALAGAKFDFQNMETVKLQTKTYDVSEPFDRIEIEEDTADVTFVRSQDGTCRVECREAEKNVHRVTVEDGTLKIVAEHTSGWRNLFSLSFENESVTVYLPKDAYEALAIETQTGDVDVPEGLTFRSIEIKGSTADVRCGASASGSLTIRVSTGDITLSGLSAETIDCTATTGEIRMQSVKCGGNVHASVSTGRVTLSDLTAKSIRTEGSTGRVKLVNTVASSIAIERDTGDVTLENSDADEIRIKTTTGDVTGTLRTGKTFVTKTSTGEVRVPESVAGGRCEITTDTGDIILRVADGK